MRSSAAGGKDGGRKPRRTWPQRLLIMFNCVLVVACLGAAFGLTYVERKLGEIQVITLEKSLKPTVDADQARNILIIGTDSAERLDEDDPVRNRREPGGLLADVIMVLRLDPANERAALLSIPRDTYVSIAGTGGENKINSAIFGENGADRLIRTVKQNFGFSIDNFVQLDFQGFRDLVEVLEGVPMYIETPLRDRKTGLLVEETGCVTLDPFQALAYARSRHLQYEDPETGRWQTDGTGDLGRISRQQSFLQSAAQRAISKGARNPATAFQMVNAAIGAVVIDDTMTASQIVEVGDQFRNFNVDTLTKFQLPTYGSGGDGFSYQEIDWDEAEEMLDVFRGIDAGQEVAPRMVQVEVGRSASPMGDALVVETALEERGFDVDLSRRAADRPEAGSSFSTSVSYGPKGAAAAALLARWIDGPVEMDYDSSLPGLRLRLDPGSDFAGVRAEPLPVDAVWVPEVPSTTERTTTTAPPPETSAPEGEGAESPPPSGPTTTVPGFVPGADGSLQSC